MLFDWREADEYRIYAGAIKVPLGGYRAALIIKRTRDIMPAHVW